MDGKIVRPIFDSVWPVDVLGFVPDSSSISSHFQVNLQIKKNVFFCPNTNKYFFPS